jgi:hypothetical protein
VKDAWNQEDMSLPFIGSRLPEANDLWELAAHDDSVGALLALPFADAAAGSLLMLHLEELFPTIRFPEQKGFDHITARYIPWLGQCLRKTHRRTQRLWQNPVTHARYQQANAALDQLNAIVQGSARDRLALAGLKLVKSSPELLRMLADDQPIDYPLLKRTARNYEGLDPSASLDELLEGVDAIASGSKSAELLHRAANNIDLFLDMFSFLGDGLQFHFAKWLCEHYARLLDLTGIAEGEFRRVILALHHGGWLAHSGPALLFCERCPDGGVVGSLRGGIMNRRLRCPLCGKVAVCVSALHLADVLQRSLAQSDGLLGAATGWQLIERRLPFCHSYRTNAGEEIDFLIQHPTGIMMVECKMHKRRGADLSGELLKDCDQLRDHLKLAERLSIPASSSMCVVNLPASALRESLKIASQQPSCQFSAEELATILHSYQELPNAIDNAAADRANRELTAKLAHS